MRLIVSNKCDNKHEMRVYYDKDDDLNLFEKNSIPYLKTREKK